MTEPVDPAKRIAELEAEVQRLARVNEVLMNRVERSTDAAGSSYSLFESNLLLQHRVNQHIEQLVQVNRALQTEVAKHRRTEQDLTWERNFVDAVLEAAGALIIVIDRNGCVVRFNRACERVSGYSAEEVTCNWVNLLIPEEERGLVRDSLARLVAGEEAGTNEVHWIARDATRRRIAWSNTTVHTPAGDVEYVVGIGIDVTEVRAAEEKLRLYEQVFLTSSDGIVITDADGVVQDCNPSHVRMMRRPKEEIIGVSASSAVDPESACRIGEALSLEASFKGEVYSQDPKDGERRTTDLAIAPITDADGVVRHWVAVGRDITALKRALDELERRNAALRKAQSDLVQSEKMAALGKLVAGIAHEINTPVGSIASMHDTSMRAIAKLKDALLSDYPDDAPSRNRVLRMLGVVSDANTVIRSGTERVTAIVRRLRSFARLDEAELKVADLHEGLEDTLSLIHHELKRDIEVVRDYGSVRPFSHYVGRLNQVFLNLLVNARQAISGKGQISIRTREVDSFAIIAIADTGCGIPPENLDKIFDPGFTTKGVGVGTGLGLSICYQIVQEHRGTIEVVSEVGRGSTFTLRVPLHLDLLLGIS
jgi:two-component system NtrC family sensor kinase